VSAPRWTIVGQGLAGTCLAWHLWQRDATFLLADREEGGSSRVAAGLINPVTGKNFEPSPHIARFLPEAIGFYQAVEKQIGTTVWHPLPVLRLAESEKEWAKMLAKSTQPEVAPWLANHGKPLAVDGWLGAFELTGGGRLDTRAFLNGSRAFFQRLGFYQKLEIAPASAGNRIWCDGAAGLRQGKYGPHRCAKGEILTIRAAGWDESRIRVGAGGWLVPLGNGCFKAGSTYEWNELDEAPTQQGRERVTGIIGKLGGESFEVITHEAGIRPILRRSEPLIGPLGGGDWMFNALGSKGSLYAPGMAARLASWLLDGIEAESMFDFRHFNESRNR
jgi:glycine/D-amino acid oxidase-like deaminating enzyme